MRRDKGDGSICQRADGKWDAWLDVSAGSGRKRKRLKRTRATKQGAKDALADLKLFAARSGRGDRVMFTVTAWLKRWLDGPNLALRPTTRYSYLQTIRDHINPFLGRRRLSDLSPLLVQDWLDTLRKGGRKPPTVRNARAVLRAGLTPAVRLGLLEYNPAMAVAVPSSSKREIVPLSLNDLDRMAKVAPKWFGVWLLVVFALGLRRGESLGLQWCDIDWNASTIAIRRQILGLRKAHQERGPQQLKTDASRRTYIAPQTVLDALEKHRQRQAEWCHEHEQPAPQWVFATKNGTVIAPRHLSRTFELAKRDGKVRMSLRIHDLRHTAATTLLSEGADFRSIADWLGHADARTTMAIYAHSTPRLQAGTSEKMQRALGPGSAE
jgi:integrase